MIRLNRHLRKHGSIWTRRSSQPRRGLSSSRTIPSAFVSVSLSAAGPDPSYLELRDCVGGLERDTLWRPGVVHHAPEAMLFSAYSFFTKSALMVRPCRSGPPA